MPGRQTALVVGPAGEEIWTDRFGRVMVQFDWDRLGEHNEKSSCWIRVSQLWAGNGGGYRFRSQGSTPQGTTPQFTTPQGSVPNRRGQGSAPGARNRSTTGLWTKDSTVSFRARA